jgi:hypothetical protein
VNGGIQFRIVILDWLIVLNTCWFGRYCNSCEGLFIVLYFTDSFPWQFVMVGVETDVHIDVIFRGTFVLLSVVLIVV